VADLGAWQTWERGRLVNRGILVFIGANSTYTPSD